MRASKNKIYSCCSKVTAYFLFTYFISLIIILNTIVLAMDEYPMDPTKDFILEKINIVFFAVFFLEMIFKMIGMGLKNYFKDYFNTFDCIIVMISCIDVVL